MLISVKIYNVAVKQELVRELLTKIVKSKPNIQSCDYDWVIEELKNLHLTNNDNHSTDFSKEINGLSQCLDWGVVYNIQKSDSKTISSSEAKNMLRTLVRDYGQQEDLARWCIETWCIALDKKVDLTNTAVSNNLAIPKKVSSNSNSNSYSIEVFGDLVYELMKSKDFNVQDNLDISNKGKQLGLTEENITATIRKIQIRLEKEKRKIRKPIVKNDNDEIIEEVHFQEEILRQYKPSYEPILIDNPDNMFVTRSNITNVIRITLVILYLLIRVFLYFGIRH